MRLGDGLAHVAGADDADVLQFHDFPFWRVPDVDAIKYCLPLLSNKKTFSPYADSGIRPCNVASAPAGHDLT